MKLIKIILILLVICAVFGAAMFGINFYTGPIIEANNAGAELAPLLAVMPEGASFGANALIYDSSNTAATTLVNVPESVLSVYKEANGLGYVIRCTATSNYSTAPMEITIGVDAEGKICGIQIDSYNDSANFDFRKKDPNYISSYIGKDSALADVGTVSGSTYSSTAFKTAVEQAMGVLIENDLIAAGVKSDAQILTELIPTLHTGLAVNGNLKVTEIAATGKVTVAYKANNGSGFAFVMAKGESSYLAVVNAVGACAIYDVEGNDVTADHADLADEAKACAAADQKDYTETLTSRVERMMDGASEFTAIELDSFNSVVAAVSFKVEDATYYAYYSRSIGFDQMDIFVIIDENGAIAKFNATTLFFDAEYFPVDDNVDQPAYKDSFVGITSESFTGENAMITGATMTSNAVKTAVSDAFAAFNSMNGGEQ